VLDLLAELPLQHARNRSTFFRFQLRTFTLNEESVMAMIPSTGRFYHFGKIVKSRAGINAKEAEKAQCALLIVYEIFEKEHAFPRLFQGVKLDDVDGVSLELLQALPKGNPCAPEVVRGEAVVWIAQQ